MTVKIYHNPRCSKSRQTLELLHSKGLQPEIIEYLKKPLSIKELEHLVTALGVPASEILRKTEKLYKELAIEENTLSEMHILELLHTHPILMQRPIVLIDKQAKIGRPPENVLEILPE